jgi:predicted MPP superfamily phosphohydrolase
LTRIQCRKFYVTGNHEYIGGGDWESRLHELGFEVLHNTHSMVHHNGGTLQIAGVPDRHVDRFRPGLRSAPDVALKNSENAGYKILLAHEPSSVFDLKTEKCDLLLAGHTHGGQIFPFGIFVRLQQPVAAGFKMINGVNVFAHQGTGFWGPPMRWFTRCEIVEFTWR